MRHGLVLGVLVGGASSRMGGRPKGLLLAPREEGAPRRSVIERTIALGRVVAGEVVLLGRAEAYASLGVPALADAAGEGPLAGIAALLAHAGDRGAIVIACDMPYVQSACIARLASWGEGAAAVAPRDGAIWSPLFARFDAPRAAPEARALLARGGAGPSALLDALAARELPMTDDERRSLRDWDAPEDMEDG